MLRRTTLTQSTVTTDAATLGISSTPRVTPFNREDAGISSVTLTAGRAFFTAFTAGATTTNSNLFLNSRGTAGVGTTLARLGLYTVDASGNIALVARSASDTAMAGATFTGYTKALDTTGGYPASYTTTRGSRYALAVLFVGSSTAPIVYGATGIAAVNGWHPWLCMSIASQTDLASSYTVGSLTAEANIPFLAAF